MGNARQQLLAALLIPTGALHGDFQPGGHLIEGITHRRKLIFPGVGDPVIQIALSQPAGPFAQQIQRFFNLADHESCEKAVCH